ncbi:MAG: hypothetical protein PHS24_05205, partial [Bacilli bacterium]|nr:hypothetical protein [Bacilli bacterium]
VMAFILILGITGRFIIFSINKNSNNAFLLSLGKLKTEMSDIVKPLSFLPTDYGNNYSIDGKMDINITYNQDNLEEYAIFKEVIDAINKIDFNYAVKIDSANKKLLYVFNPTIDNEELFNLKFYNQNKSNYVFLGNIYDKYIQLEDTEFEVTETIDYSLIKEEINQIYNVVVKSLKKNLKEEYFIKENTTIKLGTESKEVLKSTLVLDEKNVSEITINIIKSLKENKETKKIITKYVPEFFDEELEVVENTKDGPVLYFSTYMNKITGKQYRYEIESKSEYEDFSATYNLGEKKELIISNNYKYYGDNIVTYKLLIDTNKEKTNIEMKDTNNETIMTLELTKEKIVYSQNTKMDDQNAEVNFTYEFKEGKNNEEYEIIISGLLELTENNEELLTININSDNLLKKKVNIDETLKDIIKFDEMTEEDFNQIINELYNIYAKVIE